MLKGWSRTNRTKTFYSYDACYIFFLLLWLFSPEFSSLKVMSITYFFFPYFFLFSNLMTPFPDIVFINDETEGCIIEKSVKQPWWHSSKKSTLLLFRWGTHLFKSFFLFICPSICLSAMHYIPGTTCYLIIIFGTHV